MRAFYIFSHHFKIVSHILANDIKKRNHAGDVFFPVNKIFVPGSVIAHLGAKTIKKNLPISLS